MSFCKSKERRVLILLYCIKKIITKQYEIVITYGNPFHLSSPFPRLPPMSRAVYQPGLALRYDHSFRLQKHLSYLLQMHLLSLQQSVCMLYPYLAGVGLPVLLYNRSFSASEYPLGSYHMCLPAFFLSYLHTECHPPHALS